VGRVLLLYVDEAVADATPFGTVRNQAFTILPREALLTAGKRRAKNPSARWRCAGKRSTGWRRGSNRICGRSRRHSNSRRPAAHEIPNGLSPVTQRRQFVQTARQNAGETDI